MKVDPRLSEIDDCLYRVATKAIIVKDGGVLLVKETDTTYWGFPGGGVDYGETIEASLVRELVEELGVTEGDITTNFKIVHYSIGAIVDSIPRMNLFYIVTVPEAELKRTDQVAEWQWFTRDQFLTLEMSPSFANREELAELLFGK